MSELVTLYHGTSNIDVAFGRVDLYGLKYGPGSTMEGNLTNDYDYAQHRALSRAAMDNQKQGWVVMYMIPSTKLSIYLVKTLVKYMEQH